MALIQNKKTGNNLVEYTLIAALVGVVVGMAVYQMDDDVLSTFFRSTFGHSVVNGTTISLDPLTD